MVGLKKANPYLEGKVVCICMMVQQQPGDTPYSSQFLRKFKICIGDKISHQSVDLDMHYFSFTYLASWYQYTLKPSITFCRQKG